MNKDQINALSYTDFIGYINQWNVLPGSYTTLSKWKVFADITEKSNILELACTSGFSLRELALMSGCRGFGVDISEKSVKAANENKELYAKQADIGYETQDGDTYVSNEKFSHVIVGAALQFFPDPKNTIDRIASTYLADGGYLLASPFYTVAHIPESLVEKARDVFGITITTKNYKEVMSLYKDFEIFYEDRCDIEQESEEELQSYCKATTERACVKYAISDSEVQQVLYDRLMKIKLMSNELRPYQKYSVLVLRYRKDIYPNRYTELF